MDEQERRTIIRQIAQDMAAVGLGWHEDMLERLTRSPINAAVFAAFQARCCSRFPHRRYGIKGRYKSKAVQ